MLILSISFQGCVERCIFMGVRSAVPPSRHRGGQAALLLFGRCLFRCCASFSSPSGSWHRTGCKWVSFVTSFSYRLSSTSSLSTSSLFWVSKTRSDVRWWLYQVFALFPLRAGIFVKTSNESHKKPLCTFSVLNPLRSLFWCFCDKFCLKGQERDIQGQNTWDIIFFWCSLDTILFVATPCISKTVGDI